jgi:hypothetical protein
MKVLPEMRPAFSQAFNLCIKFWQEIVCTMMSPISPADLKAAAQINPAAGDF